MDYKLYEEFITLQALLKDAGIISSGGAVKGFLTENTILFNGQDEKRRGKKLRVGDRIDLPEQELTIFLIAASPDEIKQHKLDLEEKARVQALVKKMNAGNKKKTAPKKQTGATQTWRAPQAKTKKAPIRFPGT